VKKHIKSWNQDGAQVEEKCNFLQDYVHMMYINIGMTHLDQFEKHANIFITKKLKLPNMIMVLVGG
jgi:hypothetical protein